MGCSLLAPVLSPGKQSWGSAAAWCHVAAHGATRASSPVAPLPLTGSRGARYILRLRQGVQPLLPKCVRLRGRSPGRGSVQPW